MYNLGREYAWPRGLHVALHPLSTLSIQILCVQQSLVCFNLLQLGNQKVLDNVKEQKYFSWRERFKKFYNSPKLTPRLVTHLYHEKIDAVATYGPFHDKDVTVVLPMTGAIGHSPKTSLENSTFLS